ncbi:MAG: hypothetical protein WCS37_10400 [Chloroflexota bacterium]
MAKQAKKGKCSHYAKLPSPTPIRQAPPALPTFQEIIANTRKGTPERREQALGLIARTLRFSELAAYNFADYFGFNSDADWEEAQRLAKKAPKKPVATEETRSFGRSDRRWD